MKSLFTSRLLAWNTDSNDRQMPWKGEKDPYKIWLSEVILQQTRVEQGWNYYNRFLQAFPTVQGLAAAEDEKVFKLWEGLGYYSRCRNLLATARLIVRDFGGRFPANYTDLLKLRGIGPYTAAAISSFAFLERRAVLDGNVQRVLARYFGIEALPNSTHGKKIFQDLAQSLLDTDRPDLYNQAIMDFGAVICKPQAPLCYDCPQQPDCIACNTGRVRDLPSKELKAAKKHRWFNYILFETKEFIYIRQRTARDIWQDLYEFHLVETQPDSLDLPAVLEQKIPGMRYNIKAGQHKFRQVLSHQVIHASFYRISLPSATTIDGLIAVSRSKLSNYAFPKIITGFLNAEFPQNADL